MAVITALSLPDAARVVLAHGLGEALRVEPVPAGSVNSNYLVEAAQRTVFVRIYEEQDEVGVVREFALLAELARAGIPAPRVVPGPAPGALRVANKPVGVFEVIGGGELCQRMVTEAHAEAVGAALARCHLAVTPAPQSGDGRFTFAHLEQRLRAVEASGRAELRPDVARIRELLRDLDGTRPVLPRGVIHGDLFRDNVRWEGAHILGILDWESASVGDFAYDLMVTLLAWCFGDDFDWSLARAMVRGYESVRPFTGAERGALAWCARAACARFATTRLTDYELRRGLVEMQYRDYRRFLRRLDAIDGLGGGPRGAEAFAVALAVGGAAADVAKS
jgi:homoserine kinase type II